MANEVDHIALANHNHELIWHLLPEVDRFSDWVATVAFYKCVHVIEAALACQGIHSSSHVDRESSVKSIRFGQTFLHYTHLDKASRIARYLQAQTGPGFHQFSDFMSSNAVRRLIRKRMHAVEQQCLPLLSVQFKKQLIQVVTTDPLLKEIVPTGPGSASCGD